MRAFAQAERFVSEIEGKRLRPAYVFVGDEASSATDSRGHPRTSGAGDFCDFSWFDFDLADTDSTEIPRPGAYPVPYGALPGVLRARGEDAFRRGLNLIKLAAKIPGILQEPESRRFARIRGGSSPNIPADVPPHGHDR